MFSGVCGLPDIEGFSISAGRITFSRFRLGKAFLFLRGLVPPTNEVGVLLALAPRPTVVFTWIDRARSLRELTEYVSNPGKDIRNWAKSL